MDKRVTVFIITVIIVIIGFFAINSMLKQQGTPPVPDEITAEPTATTTLLVVPDQAGGKQAFIGQAVVPSDGFVVIRTVPEDTTGTTTDTTIGTTTGMVIGVSELLPAGTKENFLVDLDQEVVEGDILSAGIYLDDGDGTYTDADQALTDDAGDPVTMKFTILDAGALENEVKL